ncbi:MAG: hypothetical protein IJI41_14910 [Anaerolineaceae bacterium]|nr:hypothetical protein [Anaerolineaceae bacterium]
MRKNDSIESVEDLRQKAQQSFDDICEQIDLYLDEKRDCNAAFLSLMTFISFGCPETPHHTVVYDNRKYDNSGYLKEDGKIDFDQPLGKFLEEYTGGRIATYSSGYGWQHETISKSLGSYTRDMADEAIANSVMSFLGKYVSRETASRIYSDVVEHGLWDKLCDNKKAIDYFDAVGALYTMGLTGMKTSDFLSVGRNFANWFQEETKKLTEEKKKQADITNIDAFRKYFESYRSAQKLP